ncbi:MAG: hypothetical protein NVSMB29_13930 [Candidatus Dormibacteria bacterium]
MRTYRERNVTQAVVRTTRLRGRDLALPWGRLRVWQGGSGSPLVALHGLGGSGRYWEGLAAAVGREFTVVAPDHAGFGHSDKPQLTYDRRFHLDNLDALVDQVAGQTAVTLVGHSMGGVVAALWAARHPHRVAALALVATPFPSGEVPRGTQQTQARDQRPLQQRVYGSFQVLWPLLTRPFFSRTFPRAVIDDYMRHSLPGYWGTAQSFLWDPGAGHELLPLRGLADAPMLILTASDDRRVPARDADRWSELLPRAQREVTTGGHQLLLRSHFAPLATWLRETTRERPSRG